MENENDVADISNTAEEVVLETTEESTGEKSTEESDESLTARLAKAEELANNYKVRAEKAEKKAKMTGKETEPSEKKDLSSKDIIALMNAKVSEDDLDEVVDYAKFKKIGIAEALKTSTVKTLLAEKAEQRNVANATNTGTSRRGSAKLSEEALIENSKKGNIPDSDSDIERLMKAKLFEGRKKGN